MPLPEWFDWTAGVASIMGLGYAWWASHQATGAKQAAEDARKAVYRRNASDDVKRLERLALALLTSVETEQFDLASHQARNFISECMSVREHHRVRLGMDGGKLDTAFVLVGAISREMQAGISRSSLIESAQRVLGDMSTLSGILSRSMEVEGE